MDSSFRAGVAIIGCGEIAKVHAAILSKIKNVKLAGFADIDESKAMKFAELYGGEVYTNYKEMLKNQNVHIVHICTPHNLHAQMSIDCLNAGKHMLVEKPMALSIKDAKKMIQCAKVNNKKLGVVLQHRFDKHIKLLIENIDKFGKINLIKCSLLCNKSKEYYREWRGNKKSGEGLLTNQFIHFMDIIQFIGGEVENISGNIENFSKKANVEDTICLLIKFKKNILANIYISSNSVFKFKYFIEIHGDKGSCFLDESKGKFLFKHKTEKFSNKKLLRDYIDIGKNYYGKGHLNLIPAFINAVINDIKVPVSGEDALPSLKLVLDCYKKLEKTSND